MDSAPEFYVPEVWRAKADNVKQGSSEESVDVARYFGTNGKNGCDHPFDDSVVIALEAYNHLLKQGVCPEQARMVLPQNTMTEWIWSGSLGAFADMCRLRLDSHTQKETREVAEQVAKHLRELFPVSFEALTTKETT